MKKSRAETAETRRRILEVAAREFRRNGILGTGLAEIMSAAGLSHGGFYRHFASKDQLVAEAFAADMDTFVGSAKAAVEQGEYAILKHMENYLSSERRDDCLGQCPISALGSELSRADGETRGAASRSVRKLIDALTVPGHSKNLASARADAIAALSSLIGAATLSRIVDDRKLSDAILSETKKRLAARRSKSRFKPDTSNGK
jgi:TetR/AcrR family transcriptional repressor of nem operon